MDNSENNRRHGRIQDIIAEDHMSKTICQSLDPRGLDMRVAVLNIRQQYHGAQGEN